MTVLLPNLSRASMKLGLDRAVLQSMSAPKESAVSVCVCVCACERAGRRACGCVGVGVCMCVCMRDRQLREEGDNAIIPSHSVCLSVCSLASPPPPPLLPGATDEQEDD